MPFLQSSSSPLHASALLAEVSEHFVAPAALHTIVPSEQASVSAPSHATPSPNPSSIAPSQSLSIESQTSADEPGMSVHRVADGPSHTTMPSLHVSISSPSHAEPTRYSSSTFASQSLSIASQVSL